MVGHSKFPQKCQNFGVQSQKWAKSPASPKAPSPLPARRAPATATHNLAARRLKGMAQEGLPAAPQAEDLREATAAECQATLSVASAKVKAAKRALREPIVVHRPRLDAQSECVGWG